MARDPSASKAIQRSQFNFDRLPLQEVAPLASPLVIYVEPSSYCNLECKFCPQHISPDGLVKRNMSLATFQKLADDIKSFKEKPKKLRFCGTGEPLFNKQFLQMTELAAREGLAENLELITNGILLNDALIERLPHCFDKIIISIEGLSAEDYREFSLRQVDLDRLISNVKRLASVKDRKAVIHVKIHRSAIRNEEVDVKRFYDTYADFADEINIEGLVDMWPEISFSLGQNVQAHRFEGAVNSVVACPQIFKGMQVNSDGRVIPCCADWAAINVLGDISQTSLPGIWQGEPLRKLQIRHLKGERHSFSPCKGCTMNEYCEKDNIDANARDILSRIVGNDATDDASPSSIPRDKP